MSHATDKPRRPDTPPRIHRVTGATGGRSDWALALPLVLLQLLGSASGCSPADSSALTDAPAADGGPGVDRGAPAAAADGAPADAERQPLFSDEQRPGSYLIVPRVERNADQGRMDIDGLDVDDRGRLFLSGFVTGATTFGPAPEDRIVSTVDPDSGLYTKDIYVARYGRDGSLHWVRSIPSTGNEGNGYDLAVGRTHGEVFISGAFAGTLSLPQGKTLTATCNQGQAADANHGANGQMALLALDVDGKLRWAVQADSNAVVSGGNEVSVDAAGDVVQVGLYGDDPKAKGAGCVDTAPKQLTLGEAQLPFDGGRFDSYVAVFDRTDGTLKHLPARIGGAGAQRGKAVDAAPGLEGSSGDVLLGVDFAGPTSLYATDTTKTFDSKKLPSGQPSIDILAARVGYDGSYRWHLAFGSTGHDEIKGIAVDPEGHVIFAGTVGGPATLGGVTLDPAQVSSGAKSAGFVARVDGATGQVMWARVFGAEGGTGTCCELVVDAAGDTLLSPTVRGSAFIFDDGNTVQRVPFPADRYDRTSGIGLIVRVSSQGALRAVRAGGHATPATQSSSGELAVLGQAVFWNGVYRGALNFDGEQLSDDGGTRESEFVTISPF